LANTTESHDTGSVGPRTQPHIQVSSTGRRHYDECEGKNQDFSDKSIIRKNSHRVTELQRNKNGHNARWINISISFN